MKRTTTLHLLAAAALLLSSTAAYAVTPNPNYIKVQLIVAINFSFP